MAPTAAPLGQELLRVHRQLRERVAALEDALDDDVADPAAFRDSCLAFCRTVRRHHLGEDDRAFPLLRRRHPELADALDALVRDHEFLDPLLDRLEVLAADRPDGADRTDVERELAGISAVLENHLAYEERVLVALLDRLSPDDDPAGVKALRAPIDAVDDAPPAPRV